MITVEEVAEPQHRLSPHLRGHLLLFDPPTAPAITAQAGIRLLLLAAVLEAVRLAAVTWSRPAIPLWLLIPALTGLALLLLWGTTGANLSQLGLRPWRVWSTTEKSYFIQVLVIANVVFPLVLAGPISNRIAQSGIGASLAGVFVPYLFFGVYQELVYRGMVQVGLVRRWGALAGILLANVLYTFGPLHWNYFASRGAVALPMFASIFLIGLFFGVLYRRSGNLWIVAIFHAIGNAYIVWSIGAVR